MNEPEDPDNETTVEQEQPSPSCTPPGWISTDLLDTELWQDACAVPQPACVHC